jgi:hypothetical protein
MYHIIGGHIIRHPALSGSIRILAAIISHQDYEEAIQ